MNSQDCAEHIEASLLLRWAANTLNEMERGALQGFALGKTNTAIAKELKCSHQRVHQLIQKALEQMRHRMAVLGFTNSRQIVQER